MKPLFKGLDTETQLLVALGSAVASGCIPCLESITGLARAEGIDDKKMRAAAIIGQFVKDQPATNMKTTADRLLGTHLQSVPVNSDCPLEAEDTVSSEQAADGASGRSCGCS
jgi:AhpD family alkylhydroperoxidase